MRRKAAQKVKRDWLFVFSLSPIERALLEEALIIRAIKKLDEVPVREISGKRIRL